MRGISSSSKNKIHELIDDLFDKMTLQLVGEVPSLRNKKSIIFTSKPDLTLAHIFLKTLGSERLLPQEREALKNLLSTAEEYVSSLRAKTKAQVTESIDSYVKEQYLKNEKPSTVEIKNIINENLEKAKNHFKTIAEAESTKARNMGKALQIGKVAASQGVSDPNVYFVVVKDGKTCSECVRLHLMPDLITPRVWKLSEIGFGYHKKGENNPKIAGLHPHCFTGDMLLHTEKGLKSFKDLYESQEDIRVVVDSRIQNRKFPVNQFGIEIPNTPRINRHDNNGAKVLPATKVYYTGIRECYKITLTSGHSIEVSEDHEMWVDNDRAGIKVKAKDLKVGDKIPILQANQGFTGDKDFQELAELMGNLMGDGSLLKNRASWNFFGNDIEYGLKLFELAKKYGAKETTKLIIKEPNSKYRVVSARFSNYELGRIFTKEFGLSKKPRRVPKAIFEANRATVSAFLRGLFAADGHSENTSIVLAQNDLDFLRQIQILLSMLGYTSRIYDHSEGGEGKITYADGKTFNVKRKKCWRLYITGLDNIKRFSEEIGMGVSAKQAKLLDFLDRNYKPKEERFQFPWRTARVESIEKIGKKETYCLTEPSLNTVTVNGIVTGQCRCSLAFLAPGFGFKNGQVAWIGEGHDEYKAQRGSND
jgi:intein/homing endonuclease